MIWEKKNNVIYSNLANVMKIYKVKMLFSSKSEGHFIVSCVATKPTKDLQVKTAVYFQGQLVK